MHAHSIQSPKQVVPEAVNDETNEESGHIGSLSSKPRPLRVVFAADEEKHAFLKHAKMLRQAGICCDDYLTRLQQQERQALSTESDA